MFELNGKRDTHTQQNRCYVVRIEREKWDAKPHNANGASECVVCVFWGFNNIRAIHCLVELCSVFFFALFCLHFDLVASFYFILLFLFFFLLRSAVICYCLLISSARSKLFFSNCKQRPRNRSHAHTCTRRIQACMLCIVAHTQLDILSDGVHTSHS